MQGSSTAALALTVGPTPDGWGVYLTNGQELARYRGICSKQRALRWLRRYVRGVVAAGAVTPRHYRGARASSR